MTTKTEDVVIDSRIQPVYRGWPSDVRHFLSTTDRDLSSLRVRAGKMQKIVTAKEYLKEKVAGKTRRERVKELLAELVQEAEVLGRYHDYPAEKLGALPEDYTKKMMTILTTPGVDRTDEEKGTDAS
jgi:hypothetical protein